MFLSFRAGVIAAAFAFVSFPTIAAEKTFQNDDLAASSSTFEQEVAKAAESIKKPVAALRRDADAALGKKDYPAAVKILTQIAGLAPDESANWLKLASAIQRIVPTTKDDKERSQLLERAANAAYLAYDRAAAPNDEAESLAMLGRIMADRKIWKPALEALRISLSLRKVAELQKLYDDMRREHGFQVVDYRINSDTASPQVCFQFSENLKSKRTDFSAFVAVVGLEKFGVTTAEKELCLDGFRAGERYQITLREGLPSAESGTNPDAKLAKDLVFNIYVRDRQPVAHFNGKAYVLPRTGQRGIPVVTVNVETLNVKIYRIGDRNLIDTVLGYEFLRNVYDATSLGDQRGVLVWSGQLKVESKLNADVTTAFPIDQAVGDMAPGVYAMTAEPAVASPSDSGEVATQWFIVSDLGLAAYSGNDGIAAFANSLATTAPREGIEMRLMARNNEVLAVRTTDAAGMARFEAGITRGEGGAAPAMLVAVDPKSDYAFLNLKAQALDLSDRGVSGRPAPGARDAFVYTERGVYRTGETVNVTALLRDSQGFAAAGEGLTLVVSRPDGVEYRRTSAPDQGVGGRTLSFPIADTAVSGTWRIKAYTDPKGQPVGQTSFLVEDYVPDRLEFDLTTKSTSISTSAPATLSVAGRFLYGAPASGLDLEGEINFAPVAERAGFAGYQFGLSDEEVTAEKQPLEDVPQTDAQGKAQIAVKLGDLPESTRPLEARITVRMNDPGGRAVEKNIALPVVPPGPMIGIKPLFAGKSLGDGEIANFDVVMAAPDGKTIARNGLRYQLLRIESRYQWYKQDSQWQYEVVKSTNRVADGKVDAPAGTPGRISLPVNWGRYRLEVSTGAPDGPTTSVAFDAGSYSDATSDTPDLLEIAIDKPEYRPGETLTVAVTARTPGKVTLAVIGDRLLSTTSVDVTPGVARVPLTVGSDWGTGAYVVATLRRPLDAQASRMPGRAIGVRWFGIDRASRTLGVELTAPTLMRPRGTLTVPVKVTGVSAGDDAKIVVAAVDVGILNLTNYKPPSPDDYYLGQRRLGAEIRDLYGQLIDGMQGTRGQIRTGGDMAAVALNGSPPTQPPLALFSGLVTVAADGTARVSFDVPDFAGTVRVMAVAWSKDKVGHAAGDVIVRDPVVLTATLPRFLLTGDRTAVRFEIDNVEGQAGDYQVALSSDGPLKLVDGAAQTLKLAAKQRTGGAATLTASATGTGTVAVRVSGPGGFDLQRSYALTVKPSTQVLARRTVKPIEKGQSITLSTDLFADLIPGTGSVALSVGLSTALDSAALLQALERYPYNCSEQITSRVLPLLYANDLLSDPKLGSDPTIGQRIRDAITVLLTRQGSEGSFGLWGVGGQDVWLDAYITDFLTRARERGFPVPDVAFKLALDNLRNKLTIDAESSAKDGYSQLAYVYYVLARNGMAPTGDLRYLYENKIGEVTTPIARAQIGAALALVGYPDKAQGAFTAAVHAMPAKPALQDTRPDFGSNLRDAAAVVTLAFEGGALPETIEAAVQKIDAASGLNPLTSTQEDAWLVLASRALAKQATESLSIEVANDLRKGSLYRTFSAAELGSGVKITNAGEATIQAVVTVSGSPTIPEPAVERGFKLERQFYTPDGKPADATKARQNQRFVVVLKVTEPRPQYGHVTVADYLPAGFEIDNPHLVSSGDTGKLGWIENAAEPVNTEFRDDRFTASFDRDDKSPNVFTVAYVVRAVSPGRYVLPQAKVEDMYRPDRFARTKTGAVEVQAAK